MDSVQSNVTSFTHSGKQRINIWYGTSMSTDGLYLFTAWRELMSFNPSTSECNIDDVQEASIS